MADQHDKDMAVGITQMSCLFKGIVAIRNRALWPVCLGVVTPQLREFCVRKEPMLEENPFYGKYQDKIRQFRSASPAEYEARMEKRKEVKAAPVGQSTQEEFISFMEQETLDSILNLEMVKEKTAEEIGQIWTQYFATKDTISAVIPAMKFELMQKRAQSCPTFLYALPRAEGYEFFVGQWSSKHLHFTSLINIQTLAENAPSQLILYHYCELQEDKGIVLLTAEMDSTFLGVHEAQCLASQVPLFYATDRLETFGLVETFNHKPDKFKHMSVIAELEHSGLGASKSVP
ncbi:ATP synthase mitochondrial F1 complex assembly factor 1 isoform X2 [Protopterus annectens]|uniref:ATP synthase mitochondrial F1 complex assembly factor 1 isoform X2 n=1 Tax=Protopterus annectens TaxID=7888 RepID=UPI001CFAC981|nr:ATP synthase mitochondrial F1 complex assembly factor 1 isoform X2 [Protopterus annectens]